MKQYLEAIKASKIWKENVWYQESLTRICVKILYLVKRNQKNINI